MCKNNGVVGCANVNDVGCCDPTNANVSGIYSMSYEEALFQEKTILYQENLDLSRKLDEANKTIFEKTEIIANLLSFIGEEIVKGDNEELRSKALLVLAGSVK